jgi:hypothetical protein
MKLRTNFIRVMSGVLAVGCSPFDESAIITLVESNLYLFLTSLFAYFFFSSSYILHSLVSS